MRAIIPILLVLGIVVSNFFFVLAETEQAIITQFGEPKRTISEPGLQFKIPFFNDVHRFDKRFLEWEGAVAELPTRDKVFIIVDTFARWRISDPLVFFQRVRNEREAQSRLDDIIDGETRNAIAKHELLEVVRSSNRVAEADDTIGFEAELDPITSGREKIRQQVLKAAQQRTADSGLGIEILDVQFKRINYGDEVLRDVYDRMISERVRISDRFRSEGQGEKAETLGEKDRELQRITSEAFRTAEEIRGDADAEAADIYAKAYNKSASSREFYEFMKSMEILEKTIGKDTSLVISTEGDFYRFLKESGR